MLHLLLWIEGGVRRLSEVDECARRCRGGDSLRDRMREHAAVAGTYSAGGVQSGHRGSRSGVSHKEARRVAQDRGRREVARRQEPDVGEKAGAVDLARSAVGARLPNTHTFHALRSADGLDLCIEQDGNVL